MTQPTTSSSAGNRKPLRVPLSLHILALLLIAIELTLIAARFELVAVPHLRSLAYQFGAFWAGLLRDWQPNYPAQPYVMFFTYAFLHGGFAHLVINIMTLYALGIGVISRAGQRVFFEIYLAATIGGGIGFGLLGPETAPMVGASGALFGLAGAWLAWEYQYLRRHRASLRPVARTLLIFLVLNVVMYFAVGGALAWETHLGGFIAGWFMALVNPDKRATPVRSPSEPRNG